MSKKKKRKESADYKTPGRVKRSGGVAPYAKAQRISTSQARKELEKI